MFPSPQMEEVVTVRLEEIQVSLVIEGIDLRIVTFLKIVPMMRAGQIDGFQRTIGILCSIGKISRVARMDSQRPPDIPSRGLPSDQRRHNHS